MSTVLAGTFNESGGQVPVLPSSGGLVLTTGWPQDPQAVAGTGPDAPSWLVPGRAGTPSEGRLYAALHVEAGAVAVLMPTQGSADPDVGWAAAQQVPTGGENTCHADLNPSGTWLAAASYDSATLTVVPVLDDGRLGRPIAVQAPTGSGPVQSRQESPHLHFVLFLDDDKLLVTDLGGDRILEYSVAALAAAAGVPDRPLSAGSTAAGAPVGPAGREGTDRSAHVKAAPGSAAEGNPPTGGADGTVVGDGDGADVVWVSVDPESMHPLPPGTGPRHMAVLPPLPQDGWPGRRLAVVGELDSRLHLMGLEAGPEGFPEVGTVPTHSPDPDPEAVRDNSPSHLVVSADGALVYVANRGRNTIGVIRLAAHADLLSEVPCGGDWPRHIALTGTAAGPGGGQGAGQGLLVALERDDAVVHLPLDADGIPQAPTGRVAVRRPGFLLPGD